MEHPAALEWAIRCGSPQEAATRLAGPATDLLEEALGSPRVGRLYYGCEFCWPRLPSPRALAEMLQEARQLGLPLSLLVPRDCGSALRPLLRFLERQAPGSEVVFGDWWVLRRLRRDHPDLVPVAGRALMRLSPLRALRRDDEAARPFLRFLRGQGVRGVEIDGVPSGSVLNFRAHSMRAHLWVPFRLRSPGRPCGGPCRDDCRAHLGTLERQPDGDVRGLPQTVVRHGLRRLVYDPDHP